ncbi:hypothetical protein G3480_24355 [Thiorhodococcus mannitoliphagus]|uniref:Uncharacterized protein n=2 Tax=Thiorhodococcus mannitoliphagus TaxID=329406 RepID=A0A6P1DYI9_9GAMM|nr:hypothetical protein [Thiorhodococcus mannitoliphagus]
MHKWLARYPKKPHQCKAALLWQVAAGDTNRNYADVCIDWDVILNGPGSEGPWPDCQGSLRSDWALSERKLTDLRRFAEEIQDGDVVVLRLGTTEVLAYGIVVGDYAWHESFGDIDGWDLHHVRRVRWLASDPNGLMSFPTYTMKLGDTVQRMDAPPVLDWLAAQEPAPTVLQRPLEALPQAPKALAWDEIAECLFDQGVGSTAIRALSHELDELRRIAKWYERHDPPSESETIAYLTVPLLRALGWTPQRMAIEWNRVDVALFDRLPRSDAQLTVVVEVKPKDRSCLSARSQAQDYAQQPGRDRCQRLIVTDGMRYAVYFKQDDGHFPARPDAYLNLASLRTHYPSLRCQGAREALLYMSADWVPAR